jgi:hypothetical protein
MENRMPRKSAVEIETMAEVDRLIGQGVMPKPAAPAPTSDAAVPAHLREAGARFFTEMRDDYRFEDAASLAALTRGAECVDRIAAAQESIAKDGEIVRNQFGAPKLNPACTLEKVARDGLFAALRLLDVDFGNDDDKGALNKPWYVR